MILWIDSDALLSSYERKWLQQSFDIYHVDREVA